MTEPVASVDSSLRQKAVAEPWYQPITEFAIHTLVGTSIFVIIAGPALILHRLLGIVTSDSLIHVGLRSIEITLFAVDIVLFLIFILRTAWRTGVKLLNY